VQGSSVAESTALSYRDGGTTARAAALQHGLPRRHLQFWVQGCSVVEKKTAPSGRGKDITARVAALQQGSPVWLSEVMTERCHTASAALGPD